MKAHQRDTRYQAEDLCHVKLLEIRNDFNNGAIQSLADG
jgi:hypothetical protein